MINVFQIRIQWNSLLFAGSLLFIALWVHASSPTTHPLSEDELEAWLSYHQGTYSYGAYAPHPTQSGLVPLGWSSSTVEKKEGFYHIKIHIMIINFITIN